MSNWEIVYSEEATKDRAALDHSVRNLVNKAIRKVSQNPVSKRDGGYGDPLGNKHGLDLTGLFKIKLKSCGVRVIYRLITDGEVMQIVVIAARADLEAYEIAANRVR